MDDSNIKSWQKNLSFVPQSTYLSDDTLASNIAFGIKKSEINQSKVLEILKQCQLYDLPVKESKSLLGFRVKEHGKNLSGGQKQRVAISRSLYQDRPIIILDEATSALDLKTEGKISKVLSAQKGTKTIVSIAHRISTIMHANKIVLMQDGRITDIDSFSNLKGKNLDFKELTELANINA